MYQYNVDYIENGVICSKFFFPDEFESAVKLAKDKDGKLYDWSGNQVSV